MWTVEQVKSLIQGKAAESLTLEFKRDLPEKSDKGRAEFLKDVAAFANATGGTIIFGVAERAGQAERLSGLIVTDPDAETRRLAQCVESGVEPRLAALRFSHLRSEEGDLLIIEVPQSFDAPHRFLFNGHSKFVQRMGTHVSELTYDQLRAAFDRSSQRLERIRATWAREHNLEGLWRPLVDGPVAVIRVSSLLDADRRQVIDPQTATGSWQALMMSDYGGGSPVFNYSGLVITPSRDAELGAYTQAHRTGAVTSYRVVGREWEGEKLFFAGAAEKIFLEASEKALHFLVSQGLRGSGLIHAGISRLMRWSFAHRDAYGFEERIPSSMKSLELPEIFIEDIEKPGDLMAIMRPGFDLIWQAFGKPACPHYDKDGKWLLR